MKILRLIYCMITILCFSSDVFAEGYSLFFANGMFNNYKLAKRSCLILENKLKLSLNSEDDVEFFLAYNKNENISLQLIEVARQKDFDQWDLFFKIVEGLEFLPDWFEDAMASLSADMDDYQYVVDEDLRLHLEAYERELARGRIVIVVSHSQGNFYANNAYDLISDSSRFFVVAVATPASFVAGSGEYFTDKRDAVINAVRDKIILTLPANTANTNISGRNFHSFYNYLMGDDSGGRIVSAIMDIVDYSSCVDADGDGYSVGESCGGVLDCDDDDDAINPNASEIWDDVDNDCDGEIDEGFPPRVPSDLVATPLDESYSRIEFSWVDNALNEEGYGFRLKVYTVKNQKYEASTTRGPDLETMTIQPVPFLWLELGVRTFNSAGESDWVTWSCGDPRAAF